jgi:hypothetical protein
MGDGYSTDFELGGTGFAQLPKTIAGKILQELLEARLFNPEIIQRLGTKAPKLNFTDNAKFWEAARAGKLRETMVVHLPDCAVSEWVPRSPGRAFWAEKEYISGFPGAWDMRNRDQLGWDERRREFSPAGKAVLIYGGVGTIRLGSRVAADGEPVHFLCATFSKRLYEGIPLMVSDSLYSQIAAVLGEAGCFRADLTGRLRRPPPDLVQKFVFDKRMSPGYAGDPSKLWFSRDVPLHSFIEVSSLGKTRPCSSPPSATAVVSYTSTGRATIPDDPYNKISSPLDDTTKHIGWTFCTFDPTGGPPELQETAGWLLDYARRHSDREPIIISDFDEQANHFEGKEVILPLSDIVSGTVRRDSLSAALDDFGISADRTVLEQLVTAQGHKIVSGQAPAVRGAKSPIAAAPRKIKILFLAANPRSTTWLDLEEELRSLELELRGVKHRDSIVLVSKHAVRPDDLVRFVRSEQPTILHFSGHGTADGIVLRDDSGGYTRVTGANLTRLLKDRGVQLVVLNACYTKLQSKPLLRAVPAVVSTTSEVQDEAARRFAIAFYRSLGEGFSIRDAFRDGGDAVVLHDLPDVFWSSGDLDKVLVGSGGV